MNDSYARGPGRGARTRGPVMEVYADTGALDRPCPDCGVAVREFCVHESGAIRKTPCGGRTREGSES